MLCGIISVLGVCFECDFRGAESALDVKSENLNTIVILALYSLLPSVEFLALIDVFAAGVTSPTDVLA